MILPPPERDRSRDDNILPLINVVFLLLIFFVIAGAITRQAPFDLKLPATTRTQDRAVPAPKVLSVGANGQLAFDGRTLSATQLTTALKDWPAGQPLQVRADSALPARELTRVLTRLRAAGIAEVRLLTRHIP